ncbi:MAG TPA: SRPBCC family protein [Candidatus Acidoferrum sp.]|nr:SRPBCC family protein [Candidatus Acidoferrum sp.]
MKWVLIILGALAGIAALVAIIGALLPKEHVATRAARFAQTPAAVWQAITDFEKFPSWRDGVTSVERLPDRDGHTVWMERGAHDSIPYELVESVAPIGNSPGRAVTRIADPKLPFGGTWTLEVTPMDGGTLLRITERGEVYNPLFRFMSRFIFGYTKSMESYLSALGRKFGETVSIRE